MRLDRSWIGKEVSVVIDRPCGSCHPRYENIVYPVNCGYVPGTMANDGEPVDAYVLGPAELLEKLEGQVIGIVKREDDIEDKLVVSDKKIGVDEIMDRIAFQEQFFKSRVEC